jgi:hypothetical protein
MYLARKNAITALIKLPIKDANVAAASPCGKKEISNLECS